MCEAAKQMPFSILIEIKARHSRTYHTNCSRNILQNNCEHLEVFLTSIGIFLVFYFSKEVITLLILKKIFSVAALKNHRKFSLQKPQFLSWKTAGIFGRF